MIHLADCKGPGEEVRHRNVPRLQQDDIVSGNGLPDLLHIVRGMEEGHQLSRRLPIGADGLRRERAAHAPLRVVVVVRLGFWATRVVQVVSSFT